MNIPPFDDPAMTDFVQRGSSFAAETSAVSGDFAINPDVADILKANAKKDAAVLIGVQERDGKPHVLLTQRTKALRTHSGQIAFPGGRIDPEDASAEDAARRECEEETGIDRSMLNIIGRLPAYYSGSGYRIAPILGLVPKQVRLAPNPDEVDEIFFVPLSFLADPANHRIESREWYGKQRHYYVMPYEGRYIWGVTAGIIRLMYESLYAS
ncbi:MAG: CoA pyrophosphatase [Pseudomonadota bacterium]